MKSTILISALAAVTHAYDLDMSPPHPDYIFANPTVEAADHRIPTAHESAVMGRRILALTKLGHLATVFPSSSSSSSSTRDHDDETEAQDWRRPAGLEGAPIGMMDYVADCESEGNPTILAINIATTFQNIRAGSNLSVSVRWTPPYPPVNRMMMAARHRHGHRRASGPTGHSWLRRARDYLFSQGPACSSFSSSCSSSSCSSSSSSSSPHDDDGQKCQFRDDEHTHGLPRDTVPYSAANLPRLSLIGYLEKIDEASDPLVAARLAACFVRTHPDAKYWLPGNRIHASEWARLVVTSVYWVGGFGDRAYIGWLPVDDWHSITRDEWEAIELPGEREGWREWSVPGDEEKQFAVDL
ncbi:hypothetical protein D7B24_001243 [Verticillium nonalfalfae]|uniref:CREG-like beta-barrel domain-containing protein n=1 Tax=Verticillium nonalfalfae TaxID=1051616 RepID=A0A3M9Y1X6_9PEZI|nr:uncharacterized protein D7B24_001243 [Verticillium nonalfalfae]RNJ53886.1 hypothetical protein D7B24_001243 [Verticillium nonalfalfae]